MAQARRHEDKETAPQRAVDLLHAFRADGRGTTAIEYGMIGFLVFAVAAGAIRVYGTKLNAVYLNIGTTISQVQ